MESNQPKTLFDKIWDAHVVDEIEGGPSVLYIDKHLIHEVTSPQAFAELARVTSDIESSLSAFRPFQKINYLMLMMVDKDVHFHVLPRYEEVQEFRGQAFPDPGWPAVPDLSSAQTPADPAGLTAALKAAWTS